MATIQNMTVRRLVSEYRRHNPSGHFFDRETLKFFGESLSKMSVFDFTTTLKDYAGEEHTCYILHTFDKNHFFDVETFKPIITAY